MVVAMKEHYLGCNPPATAEAPLLELVEASFSLESRTILHPLSMRFEGGKMIGLVGHNGSGKSTLLKILARQQVPSSGKATFEGKDLKDWPNRSFARRVAYLPQQIPAAPGMLVKELVALGRYPWHGALGRFSDLDKQKVVEAMDLTGVAAFAERFVDSLSGGERQRVWLAMLVAQDVDILLLDEPTSALDINHQLEVLQLARSLSLEKARTIIAVLHDINMAARFCDHIVALHSGRVIFEGPPKDVMRPDELSRIYGVEMEVFRQPTTGRFIASAA